MEASLNDLLDNQSESLFDATVAESPNTEEICVASELNALIEGQIGELPPRVQAAFRLRNIEEFSTTEAARALGIRVTALKSRVSRARRKVARSLRTMLSTPPRPHAFDDSRMQRRPNQKSASLRQPRPHFEPQRAEQASGDTVLTAASVSRFANIAVAKTHAPAVSFVPTTPRIPKRNFVTSSKSEPMSPRWAPDT